MKTKNKILTAVAAIAVSIIILVSVSFVVFKHETVKNVFDEMYYSEQQNRKYNVTQTRFENVEQLKMPTRDPRIDLHEDWISYRYKDEYSERSNVSTISLYVYNEEPVVRAAYIIYGNGKDWDDDYLRFSFKYNVLDQKLIFDKLYVSTELTKSAEGDAAHTSKESVEDFMQKYSLTRDDIRDMQRELFDRIVTDWCEGNEGLTRFSLDNPGKFIVEDNTFDMPE